MIYGEKSEPTSIHIEEKVLMKALHTGHFFNSVVMLDVAGKKVRTLPKDVQFHPVTDRPLHADFLRIGEHSKVTVNVPVHFADEELSPGIKRGGVLNIVRHTIELRAPADNIPASIDIDLATMDINESVHVSSIKLPEGCRVISREKDQTIASIATCPRCAWIAAADMNTAPTIRKTEVSSCQSVDRWRK